MQKNDGPRRGENPFAEVELEGGTIGGDADLVEGDSLLENNKTGTQEGGVQKPAGLCSRLSIAYYQPYFDVETDEKARLVGPCKDSSNMILLILFHKTRLVRPFGYIRR